MDLPVFEVTAAGFDARTDATDDLVYWISAPDRESVIRIVVNTGAVVHDQIAGSVKFVDADFSLPEDAKKLRALLRLRAAEMLKSV